MKRDLGFERARLAPLLTGKELDELLAVAEMSICAGGSLTTSMVHEKGIFARFIDLGLARPRRPRERDLPPGARIISLTQLGWLTLLTRCRDEMAHVLPTEEALEDEAS